jgi:hypothetical protein
MDGRADGKIKRKKERLKRERKKQTRVGFEAFTAVVLKSIFF